VSKPYLARRENRSKWKPQEVCIICQSVLLETMHYPLLDLLPNVGPNVAMPHPMASTVPTVFIALHSTHLNHMLAVEMY